MQKPVVLKHDDQVAIVSLSAGTLGESFAAHQLHLGTQRLRQFGLKPVMMQHTLAGQDYLKAHPEARAADLKQAFHDSNIKGIIAAIGGNDTYRLLPYLLEDTDFKQDVYDHPKLFTGFSDTTINHLLFYKLGMQSFYGPNFLNDLAELGPEMLPYTRQTFMHYLQDQAQTPIESSPSWYEERTDFSVSSVGSQRVIHQEQHGYQVLRGRGIVSGQLLGGCLDSLFAALAGSDEEVQLIKHYHLFPPAAQWQDKILFLETSEECPKPALYRQMLQSLASTGVLEYVAAIIVGKPQNEKYFHEYREILLAQTAQWQMPILYNVNFGHAYPRTILPYGAQVQLDLDQPGLTVMEPYFQH
ncbi:S66 family peptidase [Bombilactobacillus thymidiniphilus]|uniref:LD-carboxypeptidase n=1 Tax=Bombilactobacillus thymidiniphilus TaxID=2923363 RepID=A0ABY4PBI3_9LACO|nr:S66 peptidase family protein [Bombilactobacillus thymidiniphilus]UQS83135.1 LD-carboxypeptidase [Bombilactobacillus thymidiniphilus]